MEGIGTTNPKYQPLRVLWHLFMQVPRGWFFECGGVKLKAKGQGLQKLSSHRSKRTLYGQETKQ